MRSRFWMKAGRYSGLRILLFAFGLSFTFDTQAQIAIPSLDSLFHYVLPKSSTIRMGDIKLQQAKKARLAAILSVPDVSGGVNASYTNNTRLPVNLFPAEAFGGAPGTYREVQTGVQYNTTFNSNIEVKLINANGWENLKLARINIEATASDNKIALRDLQLNLASTYFNIISLQEQVQSLTANLMAADTLYRITANKFKAGLVKQQDVNDAEASLLSTQESLNQLNHLITQQYLALKVLCDLPETESITITERVDTTASPAKPPILRSVLEFTNSELKERAALSSYRQQKYALYPTLSFFQSYTNQRYSTDGKFFNNSANWLPSSYVGLRLNIPLPGANTISQTYKARYDYKIAQENRRQEGIQVALETTQRAVEFDKAASQASSSQKIYALRKDTYQKNVELYREGLISMDQTLNSFNAMVNSRYDLISAKASVMAAKAKIEINNTVQ